MKYGDQVGIREFWLLFPSEEWEALRLLCPGHSNRPFNDGFPYLQSKHVVEWDFSKLDDTDSELSCNIIPADSCATFTMLAL